MLAITAGLVMRAVIAVMPRRATLIARCLAGSRASVLAWLALALALTFGLANIKVIK